MLNHLADVTARMNFGEIGEWVHGCHAPSFPKLDEKGELRNKKPFF